MKTLILLISFISMVNAAFDYRLFHPTLRGVYNLTRTNKPVNFAIDVTTNTLYHNTDNPLEWYYNGTEQTGSSGLGNLKSFKNGVYYNIVIDESENPNDYLGYGYFSKDESINLYAGGTPGLFMDVIRDKYHSRTMPVVDYPSFRGITTPSGEEEWPVDEGFESYDEVPHVNGFNRFEDSIEHGIVNNRAICAMTNENKYVCTGDEEFRQVWSTMQDTFNNTSVFSNFKTCATDNDVFILADEKVYVMNTNYVLPSPFTFGVEEIRCTETHLIMNKGFSLFAIDSNSNLKTASTIIASYTNRRQVFYVDDSFMLHELNLGDGSDYQFTIQFNPFVGNVIATEYSFGLQNSTMLEIRHSLAEQETLVVQNYKDHVSCADGLHIYLDNDELSWKVYSHGDVDDLQTLLDERILLDFVTTNEIGCMLVKLSDSHTGKNNTGIDYGTQADNNDDYDFAVYEDQTSDIVLLSMSSVSLAMIIASMIYYFVRIRN